MVCGGDTLVLIVEVTERGDKYAIGGIAHIWKNLGIFQMKTILEWVSMLTSGAILVAHLLPFQYNRLENASENENQEQGLPEAI